MSINCLAAGTPVKTLANSVLTSAATSKGQYKIGQPFTLTGSLGAAVHLAVQCSNGRNVVIKRYDIDKHLVDSGEDVSEYIQHEVASMKMFRNPHIINCLTSFVVNQEIWLVTPLMGYGSVSSLINTHFSEGLPELACCFILRDVLSALQYLHLQGVVHRSIRCSHILINDSGEAVLTGFRYCTNLHATGEYQANLYDYPLHGIKGNLCWMAPEILKQNLLGYTETSDIYSVGVTACEMANGVVPYSDFPSTLMMIEKLRGSSPRLMDFSTLGAAQGEDEQQQLLAGQPTLADSGVGDSVGSCNNVVNKNSTFYNREFSLGFHDFVNECTVSWGDERQSAAQLSNHPFIKQLRKTSANLLTLLHPIQPISGLQNTSDEETVGSQIAEQMENMNIDESNLATWDF